ncbi:hypothetical protein [Acinetobacter pragensis]|uniref:hypothetical protein n=1 Tax=Acinetobacter pragensis TaxID=1806892 RepID=UPI0033422B97
MDKSHTANGLHTHFSFLCFQFQRMAKYFISFYQRDVRYALFFYDISFNHIDLKLMCRPIGLVVILAELPQNS